MTLIDLEKPYNVEAMKVAAWDAATEQWGTPVTVLNIQSLSMSSRNDTDTMKSAGEETESLSVLTAWDAEITFGGISNGVDEIITGAVVESSGGASGHRTRHRRSGEDKPYFGAAYKLRLQDGMSAHIYAPKMQLTQDIDIDLGPDSAFLKPSTSALALALILADGTKYAPRIDRIFASDTALPTDFNTDFPPLP